MTRIEQLYSEASVRAYRPAAVLADSYRACRVCRLGSAKDDRKVRDGCRTNQPAKQPEKVANATLRWYFLKQKDKWNRGD
jgi:hypothetical protein